MNRQPTRLSTLLGGAALILATVSGATPTLAAETSAAARAPVQAPTSRTVTPLAEGWRFVQDNTLAGAESPDFKDGAWAVVSVPHTWNRVGYYLTDTPARINTPSNVNLTQGIGWYRLNFTPAKSDGPRSFLQFDAASRVAEVWLNGVKLGVHKGGFSRFRFDATGALHPGQPNVLVVKVDNTVPAPGNATADTLPLAGDFFVHGGLYRPVSLITTASAHFDMLDFGGSGIAATTQTIDAASAQISVRHRLVNDGAQALDAIVVARLVDASGATVATNSTPVHLAAGASAASGQSLNVLSPHLWQGTEDPYLYRLIVELKSAQGVEMDKVEQNYGIRKITIDPATGLFLNGRHLQLHGVSRHQDREGKGWGVSAADEDEDVRLIAEMGANTIRLAHYQQSEHMNDLADRYGLILWDEIPLVSKWTLGKGAMTASDAMEAHARQQLTELIRQNINHPSVAAWSIANEVDFGMPVEVDFSRSESAAPDPRPLLKTLNALARSEDPSRPSTLATCCEGRLEGPAAHPPVVADITDVFGANRYFGWYYGRADEAGPYYDRNHAEHPDKPISVSEYGAGGAITQQTDNPRGGTPTMRGRIQPEGYETWVHERSWAAFNARPYLWASWVWNMFDFATTIRREGDSMDVNTKGLVTYDRKTRKDAFYFYQANWAKAPVVHLAGRRYVDRAYQVAEVEVFSNAPATELSLNGKSLGVMRDCPNHVCVWPEVTLAVGANHLAASGAFEGGAVSDAVDWTLDAVRSAHVWIDAGALMGVTTAGGRYGSDNYFKGGEDGLVNPAATFLPPPPARKIEGSEDAGLMNTYRHGTFSYDIPLADGLYTVTAKFVEPKAAAGERLFSIAANGKTVVRNLDIAKEAGGPLKSLSRQFKVKVSGGRLKLDFTPSKGEAIVSALEITR